MNGYTKTWGGFLWHANPISWGTRSDPSYPRRGRYTRGIGHVEQCAGPVCLNAQTIVVQLHVFNDGFWKLNP